MNDNVLVGLFVYVMLCYWCTVHTQILYNLPGLFCQSNSMKVPDGCKSHNHPYIRPWHWVWLREVSRLKQRRRWCLCTPTASNFVQRFLGMTAETGISCITPRQFSMTSFIVNLLITINPCFLLFSLLCIYSADIKNASLLMWKIIFRV